MTATVSLIQLLKENVTKKLFTLVDNIIRDVLNTIQTSNQLRATVNSPTALLNSCRRSHKRLGHIALRHDENARKQLADCLYELEEKYDIPCTLDVCLFPACLLWHFDGKKRATSSADCEA